MNETRDLPDARRRRNQRYQRSDDKQKQAPSLTEVKIFPGRSHWTLLDPGWEEVADYALDWAVRNQRTAAASRQREEAAMPM